MDSQEISIELEPPLVMGRGRNLHTTRTTHSRSSSWSLPGGRGSRHSEFGMGLVSLNPITPITNVIREIVPSFGTLSHNSDSEEDSSSRLSRDPSQNSLLLGHGGSDVDRRGRHDIHESNSQELLRTEANSSSNMSDLPHEHVAIPMGTPQATPEDENVELELRDSVRWLEQNAVFIILLLVKFAWYHRSGLMVILGMFGTFVHCDQVIRNQVSLKNHRQVYVVVLVVLFLAANVYFVYYVFWDQRLHFCLVFLAPHFTVDMWNLIWSIWVTDYIIKFGTMAIKAMVVVMCLPFFPARKKGKYYMLLEYLSQFYRTIVPAPMWVRYLSNPLFSGAVFAVIITSVYLMIKGGLIFASLREVYHAFIAFLQDQAYGRSLTREESFDAAAQQCAICQDGFSRPVILPCKHIFCEDCVLQWLDRQNSCPLCRAAVGTHTPKWRDGSTARWPQIF